MEISNASRASVPTRLSTPARTSIQVLWKRKPGVLSAPRKQHRDYRKGSAFLFLVNLPVQCKPQLALLPSSKLASDEYRDCLNIFEFLFQRLRPGKAGDELVAVEECRDAMCLKQLLDSQHRSSVGAVGCNASMADSW
jgi:hypothetical protein